jgi:hypothetical protein
VLAFVSRTPPLSISGTNCEKTLFPINRGIRVGNENGWIIRSYCHWTATIAPTTLARHRATCATVWQQRNPLLLLPILLGVDKEFIHSIVEELVGIRVKRVPPAPFCKGIDGRLWFCSDSWSRSVVLREKSATHG